MAYTENIHLKYVRDYKHEPPFALVYINVAIIRLSRFTTHKSLITFFTAARFKYNINVSSVEINIYCARFPFRRVRSKNKFEVLQNVEPSTKPEIKGAREHLQLPDTHTHLQPFITVKVDNKTGRAQH